MTKVLVVADQVRLRNSVITALRLSGYQVDEALGAIAGLKRFLADHYDVILMDCEMSFMSGLECTHKMREYETGTSRKSIIVGVCKSPDSALEKNCLKAGMDALSNQDGSVEDLQQIVRDLLNSRVQASPDSTNSGWSLFAQALNLRTYFLKEVS